MARATRFRLAHGGHNIDLPIIADGETLRPLIAQIVREELSRLVG